MLASAFVAATARADGRHCVSAAARPASEPAADKALIEAAEHAPSGAWIAGSGFGLGLGASAIAAFACAPPSVSRAVLQRAALAAGASLGVDPDIALVFTTHAIDCSSIYYVPLANDARGIGYQHADAREVFDDTPGQRLEGVAFLNDWSYWQPRLGELESALNHEIGHRWGARVHALVGGAVSDALLGRGHDHWSYFLDSGGSPLEGNVWRATASGRASGTPQYPTQFSPLDRYLMGVLPASDVPPFELLVEPRTEAEDCAGRPAGPASPPQTCGSLALQADVVRVSVEDVVAAEGARSPPADDSVRQLAVLVLMLQSRDAAWSVADCELMASSLRERLARFEHASGGRVRLDNVLEGGVGCEELSRASGERAAEIAAAARTPSSAGGCALAQRTASGAARRAASSAWSAGLAALAIWRWGRRWRRAARAVGAGELPRR